MRNLKYYVKNHVSTSTKLMISSETDRSRTKVSTQCGKTLKQHVINSMRPKHFSGFIFGTRGDIEKEVIITINNQYSICGAVILRRFMTHLSKSYSF